MPRTKCLSENHDIEDFRDGEDNAEADVWLIEVGNGSYALSCETILRAENNVLVPQKRIPQSKSTVSAGQSEARYQTMKDEQSHPPRLFQPGEVIDLTLESVNTLYEVYDLLHA